MRRILLSALTGLFLFITAALAAYSVRRVFDLDVGTMISVGIGVLFGLGLVQSAFRRLRDEALLNRRLQDLGFLEGRAAADVQALSARLATVEDQLAERSGVEVEAILGEVELLSSLVKNLAESVAEVEEKLLAKGPGADSPRAAGATAAKAVAAKPAEPAPKAPTAEQIRDVRAAVEASRVELHLQPIVTLPQRRPRYYEALARLRNGDGALMLPGDFIPAAESIGLMPRIDNLVLFRAVQIERRLAARQRDTGLFINIGAESLRDPGFVSEFVSFMQANKTLAGSLFFEFSQATVESMGPMEQESLGALTDLGFRFSMDRVNDLKVDFQKLAGRGFRFVKVAADTLLKRSAKTTPDIAYADLSDMLARFGIDLVADRIESEAQVVDLLDHDIRLGQGYLFAPPRPVRLEAAVPPAPGLAAAASGAAKVRAAS